MLHHKIHKKFKWTVTLTSIAIAGFIAGFLLIAFVTPDEIPQQIPKIQVEITPTQEVAKPETPIHTKTTKVTTCPVPAKKYIDETYRNVGQDVPLLDTSYVPSNLVLIDAAYAKSSDLCLQQEAYDALVQMIQAAKKIQDEYSSLICIPYL